MLNFMPIVYLTGKQTKAKYFKISYKNKLHDNIKMDCLLIYWIAGFYVKAFGETLLYDMWPERFGSVVLSMLSIV